MRVRECPECERLWEKYTDTSFAFERLDTQLKMASLRYESLVVMALIKEGVAAAAECRDAALERLKAARGHPPNAISSGVLKSWPVKTEHHEMFATGNVPASPSP